MNLVLCLQKGIVSTTSLIPRADSIDTRVSQAKKGLQVQFHDAKEEVIHKLRLLEGHLFAG